MLIGGKQDTSVDFSPSSRRATWGSYNGQIVHPTGRRCNATFQGRKSSDGQGRPPIVWGQGIQIRPSKNPPQQSDSSSHPSTTLPISPPSISEAISKLQREKKAEHEALKRRTEQLMKEKEFLAAANDKKQQLIKSLHQELAGEDAELDDDDEDPLLHRLRREC